MLQVDATAVVAGAVLPHQHSVPYSVPEYL